MNMLVLFVAAVSAGTSPDVDSRCPVAPDNPAASDRAINTKGHPAADQTARTELAIKTKGTSAQRTASTELAIKTKGTGAQRSSEADGAAVAVDCTGADAK
jgi:hypothetical protein